MRRSRSQKTGVLHRALSGALFALLATSSVAAAGQPAVSLGEVSAKTSSGEYSAPLRRALLEELARAELGREGERFVLSARLETLDAARDGERVRATAVVSLSLRREREQTLRALLKGHATAEESGTTLARARVSALEAAVSSAVRRLPEAVKP